MNSTTNEKVLGSHLRAVLSKKMISTLLVGLITVANVSETVASNVIVNPSFEADGADGVSPPQNWSMQYVEGGVAGGNIETDDLSGVGASPRDGDYVLRVRHEAEGTGLMGVTAEQTSAVYGLVDESSIIGLDYYVTYYSHLGADHIDYSAALIEVEFESGLETKLIRYTHINKGENPNDTDTVKYVDLEYGGYGASGWINISRNVSSDIMEVFGDSEFTISAVRAGILMNKSGEDETTVNVLFDNVQLKFIGQGESTIEPDVVFVDTETLSTFYLHNDYETAINQWEVTIPHTWDWSGDPGDVNNTTGGTLKTPIAGSGVDGDPYILHFTGLNLLENTTSYFSLSNFSSPEIQEISSFETRTSTSADTGSALYPIPHNPLVTVRPLLGSNYVSNWDFESWSIDSGNDIANGWDWTGTASNFKKVEDPLPGLGSYSAEARQTGSDARLEQRGKILEEGQTYYATVWAKGTGKIDVGIVRGGGGNANYPVLRTELNDSDWTIIEHQVVNNVSGSLGGIAIRTQRLAETGDKLIIGAAWFSDVPAPTGWPFAGIDPTTVRYDLNDPDDVTTVINWNGSSSVTGITESGDPLTITTDYTVNDIDGTTAELRILNSYLENELTDFPQSIELVVSFDEGDPATLTVMTGAAPDISPDELSYNLDKPFNLTTNITWNDATEISTITHNGNTLVEGQDYSVSEDTTTAILTLYKEYLGTELLLLNDELVLSVTFNIGDPTTVTITAVEAGLNLVLNEFFNEWDAGSLENWSWSGAGGNIEESTTSLRGSSSVQLTLTTASNVFLTQYEKSMTDDQPYYVEIWVKGTGIITPGYKNPHLDTSYRTGESVKVDSAVWKKLPTYSETPTGSGENGGVRIGVKYDDSQGVPSGSELLIGAVWFSDEESPGDWPIPPQPVADLSASPAAGVQGAVLEWTAPTMPNGIDYYVVKYATYSVENSTTPTWWGDDPEEVTAEDAGIYSGVVSFDAIASTGESETGIIEGLYPHTTYWFAVKGRDSEGFWTEIDDKAWDFNDQARAVITNYAPSAPEGLKASETTLDTITLTWDANNEADVSDYVIYRSSGPSTIDPGSLSTATAVFISTVAAAVTYSDTDTELDYYYKYWIKALDDFGLTSGFSSGALASPDMEDPVIVHTPLESGALNQASIFIEFTVTDNINVAEAKVYLESLPASETHTETLEPQDPTTEYEASFQVPAAIIGSGGFRYKITASDGPNEVSYPEEGWIRVEPQVDAEPVRRFATPSNPEVVFGTDAEEVLITDVRGNEVFKQSRGGSSFIVWDPAESGSIKIESGLYIYRVKTNGGYKYGSIILAK